MRRRTILSTALAVCLNFSLAASLSSAAILYESGTLGVTGIPRGTVPGANVSTTVFNGVRFELTRPALTSRVGGHFVGSVGTTDALFGAIVSLSDANDFPDSSDLSTPDVLGSTVIAFPEPSAEVLGDLELHLDPGWYALVFGSGLFEANGDGAMPLNNPDIGNPTYIGWQPGAGWFNLTDLSDVFDFVDYRFVITGSIVPEPTPIIFALGILLLSSIRRF